MKHLSDIRSLISGIVALWFCSLFGCDYSPMRPGAGPFAGTVESPLLSSLNGKWKFDFDQTVHARKAAGTTEEEIEDLARQYGEKSPLRQLHPDITIQGNEAVGMGIPTSEYRFFGLHEHDGKICGKAWHHEDRFDPGDMSKCYVR